MSEPVRYHNLVNGNRIDSNGGDWVESYNPFTGEVWSLVPACNAADVDRAVESAHTAFSTGDWPNMTPSARGRLLMRLADLITENSESLAQTEVRDNGKLIAEMAGQTAYLPEWYRYFGGLADKIEGSVIPIDKPDMFTFTRREPLGVVAMLTPWNSPLLLLAWKLAPALAAGNTSVIKPSEFTSSSTLEFVELFEKAGFPPGVVNTVTGYGQDVGEPLTKHPDVAKISFTGGNVAGQSVYQAAARGMKKVTLELGGKSPNIIFDDADLDSAVNGAVSGIFAATGQTCIAGSRLLVQRNVHDQIMDKLLEIAGTARMGNPAEMSTQVGPVTTTQQREKILSYIDIAKSEGAECAFGGGIPEDESLKNGWFVEPTIFTNVKNEMRIAQEEVFGPVLSVITFDDEDHALAIANDTQFGLASGVWTTDIGRAFRMSEKIKAGMVWINTYRAVSFLAPFGGYKQSGIGRESGQEAIEEYLQTKTVWISATGKMANPFVLS